MTRLILIVTTLVLSGCMSTKQKCCCKDTYWWETYSEKHGSKDKDDE